MAMRHHQTDSEIGRRLPGDRQEFDDRGEFAILELLDADPDSVFNDPDFRDGMIRIIELLGQIESLARSRIARSSEGAGEFAQRFTSADATTGEQEATDVDPPIGGDIVAFDPSEFEQSAAPAAPERRSGSGSLHGVVSGERDQLQRWWVNFNGDLSLERLARLRRIIEESPFAVESRFDEIAEGLIVLRIVTDARLTMEQVDWIVRQVMVNVGMDRNAAILSQQ